MRSIPSPNRIMLVQARCETRGDEDRAASSAPIPLLPSTASHPHPFFCLPGMILPSPPSSPRRGRSPSGVPPSRNNRSQSPPAPASSHLDPAAVPLVRPSFSSSIHPSRRGELTPTLPCSSRPTRLVIARPAKTPRRNGLSLSRPTRSLAYALPPSHILPSLSPLNSSLRHSPQPCDWSADPPRPRTTRAAALPHTTPLPPQPHPSPQSGQIKKCPKRPRTSSGPRSTLDDAQSGLAEGLLRPRQRLRRRVMGGWRGRRGRRGCRG